MRVSSTSYSGGGEEHVSFSNGGYDYVVFSRLVRTSFEDDGRHDPQAFAGVVILKDGQVVGRRTCTAPADATIDARTYDLLPQGEYQPLP